MKGYDKFYKEGGFVFKREPQLKVLKEQIIKPLDIKPGKLLSVGCGMGHQGNLFSELGYNVTGIDTSKTAIQYARRNYPECKWISANATYYPLDSKFDVIFARGPSFYHYELDGINKLGQDVPRTTKHLFKYLKKDGKFILQIKTDFTGTRPPDGVHNNTKQDYKDHFSQFGEIIYLGEWKVNTRIGVILGVKK